MALSFLSYNLHFAEKIRNETKIRASLDAATVTISAHTEPCADTGIKCYFTPLASMRPSYPFEVVHVGSLHWGSYKRQVVHFCRFLVPLVRLNKQLEEEKTRTQTVNIVTNLKMLICCSASHH